ncbi:NAD(+) synthase [Synergistales bacterium]|nr:NAD(+) synthase [Synergistales bacterium]
MPTGYVRVGAATPSIKVADCAHNAQSILGLMKNAADEGVHILCLPELCVTGYTCGDLFLQKTLLDSAEEALSFLVSESGNFPLVTVLGMPLSIDANLYNAAAVFADGKLLGFVPKSHIPNYNEFYELRHFKPAPGETLFIHGVIGIDGTVPFGTKLLFAPMDKDAPSGLRFAVEICEDLWVPIPPSSGHALAGANLILNLSASNELVGKAQYRKSLAAAQSARLLCAYVYANAGHGESSTDMVFAGHNLICENGVTLAESKPFAESESFVISDVDLESLESDRRRVNTFSDSYARGQKDYTTISFDLPSLKLSGSNLKLKRFVDPHPFVPDDDTEKSARCEAILDMQSAGLQKRLDHTGGAAIIGISGGLDSSLALLVTVRALKKLAHPTGVTAVTMPCFGTTERTKSNAIRLCEALNVECREIDITESVRAHLRDIGHSEDDKSVVYENAQARVRTLVLMDIANQSGGIVVGTGDLSELALGWSTYNGDHMSMYAPNAGVPKTLVRHIVSHVAGTSAPALRAVLEDILATPVSPELLPPSGNDILQQTEDIVGPYELHDFFLYHALRRTRTPRAVYALALCAFAESGAYKPDVILSWLKVFYRRFFAQQFKRSCMPDGPKIGSVSLSPRGDWRMPSDASAAAWLNELDTLG